MVRIRLGLLGLPAECDRMMTRRLLLALLALGTTGAFLGGCDPQPPKDNSHIVEPAPPPPPPGAPAKK